MTSAFRLCRFLPHLAEASLPLPAPPDPRDPALLPFSAPRPGELPELSALSADKHQSGPSACRSHDPTIIPPHLELQSSLFNLLTPLQNPSASSSQLKISNTTLRTTSTSSYIPPIAPHGVAALRHVRIFRGPLSPPFADYHILTDIPSRRTTILFSAAALASSYAAVRYRNVVEEERKRKEGFYVTPSRSGELRLHIRSDHQMLTNLPGGGI